MKKIITLITTLLMITVAAFSASANDNKPGIPIELEKIKNTAEIDIVRKNITTKEEDYSFEINFSYNNESYVKDYFVTPKNKYEYLVMYLDNQGEILKEETATFTAETGVGEVDLAAPVDAKYYQDLAALTINRYPQFPDKVVTFLNDCWNSDRWSASFSFYVMYVDPDGNVAVESPLAESIDISAQLGTNQFGKKLSLDLVVGNIEMYTKNNQISYARNISLNSPKLKSLPKTLKAKKVDKTFTVNQTKEGLEISIPNIKSITNVAIDKINKTTGKEEYYAINWQPKGNKYTITDYFVNPGDSYIYKMSFRTNSSQNSNAFISYFSEPVKAKNGCGEIELKTLPKATYDEKKSTFTFTKQPECSKSVQAKINENPDNGFNIVYTVGNGDAKVNAPISETVNCYKTMTDYNKQHFLNTPLNLTRIEGRILLDDVKYNYRYYTNNIPGMPTQITVHAN